ncbi:hypothetical protein [Amycolatopsis magusensis]|uniref:hypothetical protein n=1 Tax=Amycolatopsis magusensis TaxID=882444 RepID=UPI0037B97195
MQSGGSPRYAQVRPKNVGTGQLIALVAAAVLLFAGLGVGVFVVFSKDGADGDKVAEKYSGNKVPACASVVPRVPDLPQGKPREVPAGVAPKYGWSCAVSDTSDPRAVYLEFVVFEGKGGATGADGARKEFSTFVDGGGERSSIGLGEEVVWSAVTPIGAVRPGVQCELHIRDGNAVLGVGAFDAMGAGSSTADCRATVEAAAKPFYDAVQP